MNERRKGLVKLAFKVLDSDNSGQIDMNDIKGVYNAKFHPDVIAEKKTEEEVLLDFLQSFEKKPVSKNKNNKNNRNEKRSFDGMITLDEFYEYYANISASVDDDDYFELMIRNAWHISGGEGWCGNTTNKRILVTDVHGKQSVQEMKNDIKIKKDDADAMLANLKSQGIENVAYINTSDKLNMKNTIQNNNIVEIRTKYANNNNNSNENSKDNSQVLPLNAFALTNPDVPHLNNTLNNQGMSLNAYARQNLQNSRNNRNANASNNQTRLNNYGENSNSKLTIEVSSLDLKGNHMNAGDSRNNSRQSSARQSLNRTRLY
jgi:hypothetical protein